MAKKGKVVWGRLPLAMHLVGLSSAACIVWAVWSLLQIYGVFGLPDVREPAKLAKSTKPTASSKPSTAVAESATPQSTQATPASHYPLEVGRYWVYRSEDQIHGVITEVERRIERKEWREEREVFVFSDGSLAYRQDGKIFEVGGSGVNVVLLEAETSGQPYVYRSQGLHIEKYIGAADTVLVVDGRRYEACIEVVTRFRPLDQNESALRVYSSYYARGVGLVGHEKWPRRLRSAPSMVLQTYGVQTL